MSPREGKAAPKNGKIDFQNFVSRIENMILTGAFKPRERLIEASLSEMFGVSRYSVRDAFKVLETKGLVSVTPFRGVVVSELSKKEVEEIFVIRAALEQLALRLSMENVTREDIKLLKRMVKKIEDASHQDDFAAMISADTEFHDHLFQLSQNTILRRMINDLRNRCHIIRYSAWSSPDIVREVMKEHTQIVEAMESRDLEKLMQLLEKHLMHAKQSYLLRLKAETALLA
ncbi:MAG: GntR family transcriptional regulator [Deltaproteobacteria bacterium]|nr:GntR family transcriptional regulator [Deltaproteobacteria bacterium]